MRQFLALSIGLALLIIISSCEKDPVAKHLSPWGDLTYSTPGELRTGSLDA
jgi:hypothetical protein